MNQVVISLFYSVVIFSLLTNCSVNINKDEEITDIMQVLLTEMQNSFSTERKDKNPSVVNGIQDDTIFGIEVTLEESSSISTNHLLMGRSANSTESFALDTLSIKIKDKTGRVLGTTVISVSRLQAGQFHRIKLTSGTVYDIRRLDFELSHRSGSGIVFTETRSMANISIHRGEIHRIRVKISSTDGKLAIVPMEDSF